jgi:hypothetical protein
MEQMTPIETEATRRCHAIYEPARLHGLGQELREVPGLLPLVRDAAMRGAMAKLYGVYDMRRRDYETAAHYSDLACRDMPDDRQAETNCLVSLLHSGASTTWSGAPKRHWHAILTASTTTMSSARPSASSTVSEKHDATGPSRSRSRTGRRPGVPTI